MATPEQLLEEWQGKIVPQSFNGGFVTLSYIVSFIGAACTLELLNRRTAIKGVFNHLLLVSAAITMGGIAIWCMHYIGNRAIEIADGQAELQIAYSSGFTALSFFMPIVVLLTAFSATGSNSVSWWRVTIIGGLAGTAICGMHYIGNASINNFTCEYKVANVVGSAIIAVAASIVALALFFIFRSSWTNSWWRRGLCGIVLAGAVSGMHWCAATGTSYRLRKLNTGGSDLSRIATVIVVVCLSATACLVIVGMAVATNIAMKRSAQKAQQVVLAVALFDKHGRLLVSPDGLLPSEKITDTLVGRSAHEVFTVQHALFQWMFRASRNWNSIEPILDGMHNHLAHLPTKKTVRDEASNSNNGDVLLIGEHGEPIENYEAVICELFCTAAEALSAKLKVPLGKVGVLWDEIMATGDGGSHRSLQQRQRRVERILQSSAFGGGHGGTSEFRSTKEMANMDSSELAEMGVSRQQAAAAAAAAAASKEAAAAASRAPEYGRGSLMFLVRYVDNVRELGDLEAAGYRFAELRHVSGIIGSSMQIKSWNLETKLRAMQTYARDAPMLEPGVHVGLFAVRARVGGVGFDVLVDREARNLLPSVPIPFETLQPWQLAFLRQLDRMTPDRAIRHMAGLEALTAVEAYFASQLVEAINALRSGLSDAAVFNESVLSAKVVEVPCRRNANGGGPSMAAMIAFCCVMPIHQNIASESCELVPLSFFKVHQLVDPDSPHHLDFLRSVHRDIFPIINAVPAPPKSPNAGIPGNTRLHNLYPSRGALGRLGRHGMHGTTDARSRVGSGHTPRSSSPHGSIKASSTKELWTGGRPSSDMGTQPSSGDLHGLAMMDDAAAASGPMQSSFGGIMVSQEITVDVHATTVDEHADAQDQRPPPPQPPQQAPQHAAAGAGEQRQTAPDSHPREREHSPGGDSATQGPDSDPEPTSPVTVAVAPIRVIRSHREEVNQQHNMGVGVVVARAVAESESDTLTFVDELFGVCLSQR
ncbi:hypothetical protein HMPREF1624_02294 [Sporothrix schenckii ATCC 58251]|uniref:MHYT domain-containing protein n=1 Tax=Sporothrix schenckii (strain ATCC 58251 / de Perez 2211183) TaxID=1391915 RepID=U7Q1K8_SPOS1|nr:hypothetical protein HMPREF1624_02294 [Sporothrix schenckii ATCC 58251]